MVVARRFLSLFPVSASVLPASCAAAKLLLMESTESYNVPRAIELSR